MRKIKASQAQPQAQPLSRPLTKSLFKLALECPAKLYYSGKPSEYTNSSLQDTFLKNLARGGFQVAALAKHLFPTGIEVAAKGYEEPLLQTDQHLQADKAVLFEAAFRWGNFFARADVLEKDGDTLRLYEVKAKSYRGPDEAFWKKGDRLQTEWKKYLEDVCFQHYVLSRAYPTLKVVPYLILVDSSKRATVDGLNQRFRLVRAKGRETVPHDTTLTARELGATVLTSVDVSAYVAAIQTGKANGPDAPDWPAGFDYASWLAHLSTSYLNDQRCTTVPTSKCKKCEFRPEVTAPGTKSGFVDCWTQALALTPAQLSARVPVFEMWNVRSTVLMEEGIHFVDQLTEDALPQGSEKENVSGMSAADRRALQMQQIQSGNPQMHFDKELFLQEISDYPKPFHFIDFETCTVALPFNAGRAPYEQIAFQFSHHVLHADGRTEHRTQFISAQPGQFPNFAFIRALKAALGEHGTVFRFADHENTVLNQVRDQLLTSAEPDARELIQWIESLARPRKANKNGWTPTRKFVDLRDLVLRFFWHPRMGGSNSIKDVLPAILEASPHLQQKYSQPVYGTASMPSLNFEKETWVRKAKVGLEDPYSFLPAVFAGTDRNTLDRLFDDEDLSDGGAAMMAYMKLQFTEMSATERTEVTNALLRYCELDTLAMVLLWEGWNHL